MKKKQKGGIEEFWENLRLLPTSLRKSCIKQGIPHSSHSRTRIIVNNFFLHIHSVRVHRHSLRPLYTLGLGIVSITTFLILCATGILLMIYYKPYTSEAYNSMKDIIFITPSGKLVRNLHYWAAHLMVIAVFLHMARVFFTSSYKKGRELNWNIGLALLILTLALSFTGYLLPWDQLAYWAATIGVNIASSPVEVTDAFHLTQYFDLGKFNRTLLLGADTLGDEALLRIYFLHCILIPALLLVFTVLHIWRIRKDGGLTRPDHIESKLLDRIPVDPMVNESFFNDTPESYTVMAVVSGKVTGVHSPEDTVNSWPHALIREGAVFMATFAFCYVLAYFFNAPLKEAANPLISENPAKSPWYFLGLQELVGYSAFTGGIVIPTLVLLGLGILPFLDRQPDTVGIWFSNLKGIKTTLVSALFASASCLMVLAFSIQFGWLRNAFPQIPQIIITIINPGTLLVVLFLIWSLCTIMKTNSIRLGAISLFTCISIGFILLTYFASVHRGPHWIFYWWPSLWSSY